MIWLYGGVCSLPMYSGLVLVWDGYPLSYKIRESKLFPKLFPKLFSRFLCVFKIKAYLCNQQEVEL